MPKRTNLFQEVVAVLYEHLAGDAVKEESAMLTNRLTGEQREVDVVLRAHVAGHETVIAVEATARSSPVSAPWVESMVGKHANLPTDKLVLVSESGFTKQARALAKAENVVTIAPEDIAGNEPAAEIVKAMPVLWPKTADVRLLTKTVYLRLPDGSVGRGEAPDDLDLVLDDGETVWSLLHYVAHDLTSSSQGLAEALDLVNVAEDMEAELEITIHPPFIVDGKETGLSARRIEGGQRELHPIERIVIAAKATVQVDEIKLTHKHLAALDVTYAYGEGTIAGQEALAVVSEGKHGRIITFRVKGDEPAAD